jgi:hypothetical protein
MAGNPLDEALQGFQAFCDGLTPTGPGVIAVSNWQAVFAFLALHPEHAEYTADLIETTEFQSFDKARWEETVALTKGKQAHAEG